MIQFIRTIMPLLGVGLICCFCTAAKSQTFLLGDQDYSDGSFIDSNGVWLAAQADETYPFFVIHTAPTTINFAFLDLPVGTGKLTISLWDLDTAASDGNAVTAFTFNGIAQSTVPFAAPVGNNQIKWFEFPVVANYLNTGWLSVAITISRFPGNEVGIDFARLDVTPMTSYVPEPGTLPLLTGLCLFASAFVFRRTRRSR